MGKGIKVALSVVGATNWAGLNVAAIKSFVDDMGITSVDIDYEPSTSDTASQQLLATIINDF
jgi:ABC-type nitrate/sulfonate/bicarbonate transport system substrate-binding protein